MDNKDLVTVTGKSRNKKPKLTIIIISSVVVLLLVGITCICTYYFGLNDSELRSLETKVHSNKDINEYFSGMSFSRNDKQQVVTYKGVSSYPYHLIGYYNKKFSQLSDNEKINALTRVKDVIQQNGKLIKCGYNKYCSPSEIDIMNTDSSKVDIYSFDTKIDEIKHSYDQDGVAKIETLSKTDDNFMYTAVQDPNNPNKIDFVPDHDADKPVYTTEQTKKDPEIGMTANEVKSTTWGKPDQINKTTTANGVSEQWVYDDKNGVPSKFVYLDNGIVTSIQESN